MHNLKKPNNIPVFQQENIILDNYNDSDFLDNI